MLRLRFGGDEVEVGTEVIAVREDQLPIYFNCEAAPQVPTGRDIRGTIRAAKEDDAPFRWKWWPWGVRVDRGDARADPAERRYAVYDVQVGAQSLRVDVQPVQVLSQVQYLEMVRELIQLAPAGLFDEQGGDVSMALTEAGRPLTLRELLPRVEEMVDADLAAAGRIARQPFTELGPRRPTDLPLDRPWRNETDLSENRVAWDWATVIGHRLDRWISMMDRACRDLDEEVEQAGLPAPKWTAALVEEAQWIRENRRRLERLRGEVAAVERLMRPVVLSRQWTPTPSLRRRADPGRLARALVGTMAGAVPEPLGALFSALSPRSAPFIFELWSAWRIAAGLQALGFEEERPLVDLRSVELSEGLRLPRRALWTMRREHLTVTWHYGPRARTLQRQRHALVLSSRESAAIQAQNMRLTQAFVSVGAKVTPDYALCLEVASRLAWLVGDAVFGGTQFPDGVTGKLDTVQDYGRQLLRMDHQGRPVRCRGAGSFVVVPGTPEEWENASTHTTFNNKLLNMGVILLPLEPGGRIEDVTERLRPLLETLEWAAMGGLGAAEELE